MTRAYAVPSASATAVGGAVAGLFGGVGAIAVLMVGAFLGDRHPVSGLNVVGAFSVRWLQTAAPDALDQFYWDASVGGGMYVLFWSALGGALFALILARLPDDHPIVWGGILGASAWVVLRFVVAPALDPLLVRWFDWKTLLPACLAFGLVVGYWIHLSRDVASSLIHDVLDA